MALPDAYYPGMAAHAHGAEPASAVLKQGFFLTVAILVVEIAAGMAADSLALLADAGHLVTDVVALGMAWFAAEQAKRPADARRTYGYHRVGILAAMLNGATLIAIALAIGFEAVRRLSDPRPVSGGLVIASAAAAIAVNAFIALRLRRAPNSLNVRAALLHVVGDLAASIGVVLAGIILVLTGWYPIDPIISLLITALIAVGAVRVVIDTGNILLEGVPRSLSMAAIESSIAGTSGVTSVHDLHVWALSSEQLALSCHVVVPVPELAEGEHLVRLLERLLCESYGIGHTTIQIEACHQCQGPIDHGFGEHNHPHPASIAYEATHSHP